MLVAGGDKTRRSGGVKLLDFGLAAHAPARSSDEAIAISPVTRSAPLTMEGTILGTLPYMAPEQVNGSPADARSDIWAFGCVLHEMVTGHRAFEAVTDAGLIGAILEREPASVSQLRPGVPAGLDDLVRACLTKDPDGRWQSAQDLLLAVRWLTVEPGSAPARHWRSTRWRWPMAALIVAGLAGGALTAAALLLGRDRVPPPAGAVRASLPLPPGGSFSAFGANVAMSPDGRVVVYVANDGDVPRLFVRTVDQLEARPLRGTDGAETPFFAPDGRQVGFEAGGMLKRVSLDGGAPADICPAAGVRGAAWAPDGTIVFTPTFNDGLWRVKAGGGTPEPFTRLNTSEGERTHRFPEILPDGRTVLFMVGDTSMTSYAEARIVAQSLDGGPPKTIHRGGLSPKYLPSGYLLYNSGDGLVSVPFDPVGLEITGAPVTIAEDVAWSRGFGTTQYAAGGDGHIVYIPGGETFPEKRLVWLDRAGSRTPIDTGQSFFMGLRLSPDAGRLVLLNHSANDVLNIYDLRRQGLTRLTFRGSANHAAWTSDGRQLVHIVGPDIVRVGADGGGDAEVLHSDDSQKIFLDLSPDGSLVAYDAHRQQTGSDIMLLSLADRSAVPWQATRFNESLPRFSPDGRWIAYVSDEGGRFEVFVRATDASGLRLPISTHGGTSPVWSRTGDELFFVKPVASGSADAPSGDLYAVDIRGISASRPRLVLEGAWAMPAVVAPLGIPVYPYDVMPDGQRFVLIESLPPPRPSRINLLWNVIPAPSVRH